jgi:hypothetical protein
MGKRGWCEGKTSSSSSGRMMGETRSTRLKAANDPFIQSWRPTVKDADGGTCYGWFLLVYSHETQLRSLSVYPSASALFPVPPMSSKRGRKRNDNLPPNRARDVQRAFRARRAAHLEVGTHFAIISKSRTFISSSHMFVFILPIPHPATHDNRTPFSYRPSSIASQSSRRKMVTSAPP